MTTTTKTAIKATSRRGKTARTAPPPRMKRAAKRDASIPAEVGPEPAIATTSAADQSIAKSPANAPVAKPGPSAKPGHGGKLGLVVALLRRPEGATVVQMSEATDWLPHSVRGAIAGALKKKHKLPVVSEPSEGGRVYRLAPERSAGQGVEQNAQQSAAD